jgi:carbon monoxide dehydrogenase subunit G
MISEIYSKVKCVFSGKNQKRIMALMVTAAILLCTSLSGSFMVSATSIVNIPDANLAAALSQATGKPVNSITDTDLQALTSLNIGHKNIVNLTGLEYATNLTTLTANNNSITDLSPLSGLNNLHILDLSFNYITDFSPLENTGVNQLTCYFNYANVWSGTNKSTIDSLNLTWDRTTPQLKVVNDTSALTPYSILTGDSTDILISTYFSNDGSEWMFYGNEADNNYINSDDAIINSLNSGIATGTLHHEANGQGCKALITGISVGTANFSAMFHGLNTEYTTLTFSINVSELLGSVQGRVTDAASGVEIPGATVDIGGGMTATTDAAGYYIVSNLAMGDYTVNASATGYTSGTGGSTTLTSLDRDHTVNIALAPIKGSITGQITDATTGNPIQGATVRLNGGVTTSTDATGHYSFTNLTMGDYALDVSATGYTAGTDNTILTLTDKDKIVNITLSPIRGSITGRITDVATGNPIQGASVSIGGGHTTTTDATGHYSFSNLDMGLYTVSASASGYSYGIGNTILITADKDKTVDIALFPVPVPPVKGSITGQITDAATGNPIQGATVGIGSGRTAITDATGHYSFSNLDMGPYTVSASASSYKSGTGSTTLTTTNKDKTVSIALSQITGTVTGRVTLSDGTPLSHVQIELHSTPRDTYTDANGYYSFTNVPLGSHTVFINDDHFTQLADNYNALKVIISVDQNNSAVTTYTSGEIDKAAASLSLSDGNASQNVDFIAISNAHPAAQPAVPTENPHTGDNSYLPVLFIGIGLDAAIGTIIVRKKILKRGK